MLPVELGNVRTLRALNLRCCPVEFPPQLVVQKGPAAILSFLRAHAAEPASRAISPPEKMTLSQLPHPHWDLGKECAPSRETTNSQGPEGSRLAEAVALSELRRCPRPCQDWPTEEELRRFWTLRQEIVEKEQVEVLENQLLAVELPPNLRAMLRARQEVPHGPRHALRRAAPSFKGALPGLAPTYPAVSWAGRLEERRASALRELREKQALMEQRRRDQQVLREWREQAQAMKREKEELGRLRPPRRMLVASEVPFATDLPDKARAPVNPLGQRVQSRERLLRASDELRAGRQGALEERLRRHVRRARELRTVCGGPGGGPALLGEMRQAAEDLEIVSGGRLCFELGGVGNNGRELAAPFRARPPQNCGWWGVPGPYRGGRSQKDACSGERSTSEPAEGPSRDFACTRRRDGTSQRGPPPGHSHWQGLWGPGLPLRRGPAGAGAGGLKRRCLRRTVSPTPPRRWRHPPFHRDP